MAQPRLHTLGHGTQSAAEFTALLRKAGLSLVVDVRRHPGSRRHPWFSRDEMTAWLPDAGVAYRWAPELGGRRSAAAESPNVGLRNASFRAYADYMRTDAFATGLDAVLADAAAQPTAVLCAETLWWRCHRRLLADAAVLLRGATVVHLDHDGGASPHTVTDVARRDGDVVVYDAGEEPTLPLS